jgi:23S rRNA (uridine2552-2'-O)-methyltransferase
MIPVRSLTWLKFGNRYYSSSSKKWLSRQAGDRFVKDARAQQYRARSAFKLIQLNEKHRFLKKGSHVIELGASPGGWTQVIAEKVFKGKTNANVDDDSTVRTGTVIAVDLLPTEPIPGVNMLQGNFLENGTQRRILEILNGKEVDAVLSDMAPSFSGNHHADHAKSMVSTWLCQLLCRATYLTIPYLGTMPYVTIICCKYFEKRWRFCMQGRASLQ